VVRPANIKRHKEKTGGKDRGRVAGKTGKKRPPAATCDIVKSRDPTEGKLKCAMYLGGGIEGDLRKLRKKKVNCATGKGLKK